MQHPDPPLPGERRPIAARDWQMSRQLAGWLTKQGASPNGISIAGMICGILAGAAFALTQVEEVRLASFVAAALLIQLRLLANMLDGMVAIASGQVSPVGELYNDVPDRVSDAATIIGAGYAWSGAPALGYLAACLALFTAYVRVTGKAAGTRQEFCGPMAKQQRMFLLTSLAIVVAVLPPEWHRMLGEPPRWGLVAFGLVVIIVGAAETALRRLVRIAAQLRLTKS
jgi:phosphatidylglycerophosphate synthase